MKNRAIPNTNFKVSPICLGTMTFGTPVGEKDAIQLVHWAIDHEINFIDTANMYEGYARTIGSAGGVAEAILGKALKRKREKVILATKVGMKVGDTPEDEGTSPAAIRKQLDKSLKRLYTDYIDIYYLHRPDTTVALEDILIALDEAIKAGKIKHYGVSNYSAEQLSALLTAADDFNLPRPVIIQPHYSLLKRDIEKDLLPLCVRENIAVAPYRVLEGGMLTGKYQRESSSPAGSRANEKPEWMPEISESLYDQLEQIKSDVDNAGLDMTGYTIRWTLNQPAIASLVLGVKHRDQLAQAIRAASI